MTYQRPNAVGVVEPETALSVAASEDNGKCGALCEQERRCGGEKVTGTTAQFKTMNVQSIIPKFGENYDVGYIGFTFYDNSFVSQGIAYFERWNRISDIKVSHAFVVTGDDQLVEAHIEHGVWRDSISKYFNDPHVHTFFRKPVAWDGVNAQIIASAAESKIGCKYDSGLIAAECLADSVVGHWLNNIFRRYPNRFVSWMFNRPNRFICSELAAYSLSQVMELYKRGILRDPLDMIDPQELFEDAEIFEDWVRASGHGPILNTL